MSRKKLVLVPSESMVSNKKRDENILVRMSEATRKLMGLSTPEVEVSTAGGRDTTLKIFKAFSKDIKHVRALVANGELSEAEAKRVGFVTVRTYNSITGGDANKNIWISTSEETLMLGADPEFLLFRDDAIIRASSIGGMDKVKVIGCDGPLAEVRPKPSSTPKTLVQNIQSAFRNKSLTDPIKEFSWMAGCYYVDNQRDYTLGGHIHVGNPKKVTRVKMPDRMLFFNVLNKVLDEHLAIPCIRLDGDKGRKRRTGCKFPTRGKGFGWFGEWRPHDGRLEHRTLSGMWLMHPSLARCVIGTAKAITEEVFSMWAAAGLKRDFVLPERYSGLAYDIGSPPYHYHNFEMNKRGFSGWKHLPICKALGADMTSASLIDMLERSKASDINAAWLNEWHAKLRNMSTYKKYSKYIDGLRAILRTPIRTIEGWPKKIQDTWLSDKKFVVDV